MGSGFKNLLCKSVCVLVILNRCEKILKKMFCKFHLQKIIIVGGLYDGEETVESRFTVILQRMTVSFSFFVKVVFFVLSKVTHCCFSFNQLTFDRSSLTSIVCDMDDPSNPSNELKS